MTEYHKINAPFKRDGQGNMLHGEWCMPELEYLANSEWEFTEKVDGTNMRLMFNNYGGFWIGGRTDNAQIPKPLFARMEQLGNRCGKAVSKIMRERDIDTLTIYGEGYGPKINGGGKYKDTPDFVAFDIKVGDFWLLRKDVNDFCQKVGLDSVPVLGYGTLRDAFQMVTYGTRMIDGEIINVNEDGAMDRLSSRWGDFEAEGIIAVPKVPLFDRAGRRIITKIKAKDFRL